MNVVITPSVARGEICAPPSKSCAHRLLISAALCSGESVIENIGINDDITATAECLREMGAVIDIDGATVKVKGIGQAFRKNEMNLFCNESGSTLRFLIPLSLVFSENVFFTGKGRLMERPQSIFEELFAEKGCFLGKSGNGLVARGELKSGTYKLRGDVSSQFITGLLFTLPLLKGDSEIILTTELQSAPYVDITVDILSRFGIVIEKGENRYCIKGSQEYKSQKIVCEGDWSNGAFLDAFNLIDGGDVSVMGLRADSFQGDKIYKDFYRALSEQSPVFDISDCPDLGPVLITCAVLKNGATINGTKRLKIKESDRGAVMAQELKKFGVDIEIGENCIIVPDKAPEKPTEPIDCHNDHRIAMSFSVLCSVTGGELSGAECVNKSYPEFFEDIRKLGINILINP